MIRVARIGEVEQFTMARSFLGRPGYHTACYRVDGTLIDTGCAHCSAELVRALGPQPVKLVLITHSHEDHIGSSGLLQKRWGTEVLAHPLALPVLRQPRVRQRLRTYQRWMWGYPLPSLGHALDDVTSAGHNTFRVIPAPGHSPDHVCFYEPERGWLFTGDAFIGGRERALRRDYRIWEIIGSLKRLAALPIETLFPASGRIRHRPRQEILDKIDYLEALGRKVLDLHARGIGPREIRRRLLGRETTLACLTGGHFSGVNLVRSYIEGAPGRSGKAAPEGRAVGIREEPTT